MLATVTKPFVHSYASRVIVIVDAKNSWFGRDVTKILNSCICGFYGCSVTILAIHFMYRYGSLDKARRTLFEGWRFVFWCLIPVVYGIIWGLTIFFIFPEDDGFTELIRKDIWDYFELKVEDIVYTGPYYYPEDRNGLGSIEPLPLFGMLVLWFVIGSSSLTVMFFGFRCYKTMRSLLSHSTSKFTQGLQQQLFKALVWQTIIPLIMLYIPCSIVFICPLLQINIGNTSAFITVSVAVYPAIDTLPNIFIIKNFKKATLGLICGFYGCSVSIFAIHFMYRYGALDKNQHFKGWKLAVLCSIPIFYGVIWGLTMHFVFEEDPAFTEFIRKDIWDLFELPVEDIVYTGSYYYPQDKNGVKEMNWRAAGGMAVLWFVIGSSSLTVIYFGLNCYFEIRNLGKGFSKKLQSQLFRALVIQAAIPLLLLYIPCSIVFVCPLIQIDLGNMSAFISVSVAIYPAIDPLPTLLIVKSYRKATKVFSLAILVQVSYATNRDSVMTLATSTLGLTFYTAAELTVIAKCCEPQFYATPNNNTAILQAGKKCILQNSSNKALQALALYSNANNCLNPETVDSVISELVPAVQALSDPFVTKVKSNLSNCKSTNTQTGAAKQEACLEKVYGIVLNTLSVEYIDNICKQVVNENVTPQEWSCGLKYIPSLVTFSKYSCSKIVKN
uniref:Serpentine receptor class r-10 n=1 Tax=Caenorhabditis tropicalis TaxID=1561998 RepID=A0A1I7V1L8_9PELO